MIPKLLYVPTRSCWDRKIAFALSNRKLQFALLHAFQICGFPMHFAYSDADQLSESLRSTGVHLNQDPRVEFALAVHVTPYPATVMSVWVYVASMVRRDAGRTSVYERERASRTSRGEEGARRGRRSAAASAAAAAAADSQDSD